MASIADWLVWPTACDYYFYLKIIFAIMIVLAWTLYKAEEKRTTRGDFISALGTSSISMVVLAIIGTLIQSTDGIPMIQLPILLYILAVAIPIILIWFFKRD